jgi:DNA-binding transcriptional ArsR family regulator
MLFAGGVDVTVSEAAERMSLARSATATHLAVLRDGGLPTSGREWKTVFCRADPVRIGRALSALRTTLPPTAR